LVLKSVGNLQIVLSMPDRERSSVLSTLGRNIDFLGSPHVEASVSSSDVTIEALVAGSAISVYMILPPERLESHRALLRLWLTAILTAISRRRLRPERPTLMIVDECGQLGRIPHLASAVTLMRGYGLQPWLFFQDFAQLKGAYPSEWPTFITNAQALNCFGFRTARFCSEASDVLGYDGPPLLGTSDDRQLVATPGAWPRLAGRLNYLTDPEFASLWRPNPTFASTTRRRRDGRFQ